MTSTKIQCNSCGAKFFTLDREAIQCKCGHQIIVKEQLSKKHPKDDEIDLDINNKDDHLYDEEDSLSDL